MRNKFFYGKVSLCILVLMHRLVINMFCAFWECAQLTCGGNKWNRLHLPHWCSTVWANLFFFRWVGRILSWGDLQTLQTSWSFMWVEISFWVIEYTCNINVSAVFDCSFAKRHHLTLAHSCCYCLVVVCRYVECVHMVPSYRAYAVV